MLETAGYAGLWLALLLALNAALVPAVFGARLYLTDPVAAGAAAKLGVMLPALSVGLLSRAEPRNLSRRAVVWLVTTITVIVLLFQSVAEACLRGPEPARRVRTVPMRDGSVVDVYRGGFYGAGSYVAFEVTRSRPVLPGLAWGATVGRTGYVRGEHAKGPVGVRREGSGLELTFSMAGTAEHVTVR